MANIQPNSKSATIRQMTDQGMSVSQIARELNSNYSFVYGVVQRHKAATNGGVTATKKNSVSGQIRTLFDAGKSIADIKKELNLDYSFVYSVVKAHKKRIGGTENV